MFIKGSAAHYRAYRSFRIPLSTFISMMFLVCGFSWSFHSTEAGSITVRPQPSDERISLDAALRTPDRSSLTRHSPNAGSIRFIENSWQHPGYLENLNPTVLLGRMRALTGKAVVSSITTDEPFFTLVNDTPVTRTVIVEPPGEVNLKIRFFREAMSKSFHSVNVIPLHSSTLKTDANGVARFILQASYGGQGLVWCEITDEDESAVLMIDGALTNSKRCESCNNQSGHALPDPNDNGNNNVKLYSGERTLRVGDLTIPGRGFDYQLARTYRSQASHLRPVATGDFGVDWALSYSSEKLIPDGNNIVIFRDSLRTDVFIATKPGVFLAPMEYYEQLSINSEGDFELRDQAGMVKTYRSLDDPDIPGRLVRMEDRNGNFMRFIYERLGGLSKFVLATVVDTMGRNIRYRYYSESDSNPGRRGRLKEVEDFRRDNSPSGRKTQFDYDEEGNLASVTSPTVQGTPNGNNFPGGKTFRYAYTSEGDIPTTITGIDSERLSHNLVGIEYPNEVSSASGTQRESLSYGAIAANVSSFDRVLTYTLGGNNEQGIPAGGTINYSYDIPEPKAALTFPTTNNPFLKTTVKDRRGNVTEYVNSPYDTLLEKREFTRGFRIAEPAAFDTKAHYNSDKMLVRMILPEGNINEYAFDERSHRFQQGNLIGMIRLPDMNRGGDQNALLTETVFEPIYQQPAAVTDSRGLAMGFIPPVPDSTGRAQRDRYTRRFYFDYQEGDPALVLPMLAEELRTTTAEVESRLKAASVQLGLGDLNGDGDITPSISGDVVREVAPSVVLLPDSHQAAIEGDQAQDIITQNRYNQFGQLTSTVDPEGNVHTYTYFSEADPDGDLISSPSPADDRSLNALTGGYLKEVAKDTLSNATRNNGTNPMPANILLAYAYDDVGNRTSAQDGRGIRTDFFVNELNQVVQITRAAAVPAAGSGHPPEPMPLIPFAYRIRNFYDFNNNITRREIEDRGNTSNTGGFVEYNQRYDILDNPIEMTQEVSINQTLVTKYRYDSNENLVLTIQPEGNAKSRLYDERDMIFQSTRGALAATSETLGAPPRPFNPRSGESSTVTFNYDKNRNLSEKVDAEDTDDSELNNSSIAGDGDATRRSYDGFDRTKRTIDPVGNETILNYDPVNNVIRETKRGPAGGESPRNTLGINNVELSITEYQHDELSRVFQEDKELFTPQGTSINRMPNSTDGDLTPGDGKVTTRYEYDRKSRRTLIVEDNRHSYQIEFDGVDRVIKKLDPEGNLIETAYDDNNNVIETQETDISQVPDVRKEIFLQTFFYDSLDRPQRSVDNLGQAIEYRYDSRNNLVAMADSNGPLTGQTISRRAFPSTPQTVNSINDFGNVISFAFDGINRIVQRDVILTRSGRGDGVRIGANMFGGKTRLPRPNQAQGGGDGKITIRCEWDANSLLASLIDDNGNETRRSHDNLNRRVSETKGICVEPLPEKRCDPPTTITYEYDKENNVVRLTDENGSIKVSAFDALNRSAARRIIRAPGVVGTTEMTYQYDGLSRRTRATANNDPASANDDSVITYAFDSLNRIIEETQKIGSLPARAISSSWKADNHRTELIYPNGRVIELAYDKLDRLDTISDQGATQLIADYNYIGTWRIAQRKYPINGTEMTYLQAGTLGVIDAGYDAMRRPVRLRHVRSDNTLIVGFSHNYDRMNNKLDEGKLHDETNSETYTNDSAYRLIQMDRDSSGIKPQQGKWKLDGVGNWRQVDGQTREHSSFNEITKVQTGSEIRNILYDNNGNQIDDGHLTFHYDSNNRLCSVSRKSDGLPVAAYSYDANGRRIRKVVTSSGSLDGTTDFYLDGQRDIEERDGSDSLIQQYVYGLYVDEPLVLDRNLGGGSTATGLGDQRLFYHQNTLASVYALTDISGKTIEAYQYDGYGQQTIFTSGPGGSVEFKGADVVLQAGASTVANPYLFTGRRLDSETLLYHYRHRYFNSEQGRFIHRDPLGPFGDGVNLGNSYAYTGNLPATRVDPTGLYIFEDIVGGVSGGLADLGEGALDLGEDLLDLPRDIQGLGKLYETVGGAASDYIWRPFVAPVLGGVSRFVGSALGHVPFIGSDLSSLWRGLWDTVMSLPPFDLLNSRPLNQQERKAATSVFNDNLNLNSIRIAESVIWGFGTGARTPWNVIYFNPGQDQGEILIHELTHAWQTQHGITWDTKLFHAIKAEYDYGGEAALQQATAQGRDFLSFNTEQQGDILQDFYNCFVPASEGGRLQPICTTSLGGNNITDRNIYQPYVDFVRRY